jgi:hypothetical protein
MRERIANAILTADRLATRIVDRPAQILGDLFVLVTVLSTVLGILHRVF